MTGVGFVALAIVAVAVPGEPPKADAAASEAVRYFADKRTEVLASSSAWFIAAIMLLWFFGVLQAHLHRPETEGQLSATALRRHLRPQNEAA